MSPLLRCPKSYSRVHLTEAHRPGRRSRGYPELHERKRQRPVIKGMYHLFLGNIFTIVLTGISSIAKARFPGPERYALNGLAMVCSCISSGVSTEYLDLLTAG